MNDAVTSRSVPRKESGRPMLTPETWIAAAIDRLMLHGIDSVRVEILAKEMSVSRGSFYWHFKDRDDLLRRVLKSWQDGATEALIARFEEQHHEPRQLIKDLLSLPFRGRSAKRASSIELAIRAWSRSDNMARMAVEDVDARRIAYIAQVFSALGCTIKEARSRAFALYAYTVTESLLTGQGSNAQQAERSSFMETMLTAKFK